MEVMGKRGVKEGREPILGLVDAGRERRGGIEVHASMVVALCSLFV